jgi:hypothetical protein
MTEFSRVVFNSGEPIDINKLNQLQANLNILYTDNASLKQTSTQTVSSLEGLTKDIEVVPILAAGMVICKVNGNSQTVEFNSSSFSATPYLVATISSNIASGANYSVRATADNETQGRVEVVSTDTKLNNQEIRLNWIALQMKPTKSTTP